MSIEELKIALVKAREENEHAKETTAQALAKMEDTPEGKEYKWATDTMRLTSETLLAADKELRDAALAEWNDVNNTHVGMNISPGVKIQFHHNLKYDLKEVIAWAEDKAKHLFKFDVKAFDKNPPEGAPFTRVDEPYVVLSSKNSDFQLEEK